MIKGQCLCGAVQYQYDGEIEQSILCYCQHCQQAQGSIAGWNSPIDQTKFQFISGQDQLKNTYILPIKLVCSARIVEVQFIRIVLIYPILFVCVWALLQRANFLHQRKNFLLSISQIFLN